MLASPLPMEESELGELRNLHQDDTVNRVDGRAHDCSFSCHAPALPSLEGGGLGLFIEILMV